MKKGILALTFVLAGSLVISGVALAAKGGGGGGNKQYFYLDYDQDGYGDPLVYVYANNPDPGYVSDNNDCNDNDETINPGVSEIEGDMIDQNCDGYDLAIVESAGQIWRDRNIGASRVATSVTDSAAYGELFQWGRAADGHQVRYSTTTTIPSPTPDPGHSNFIINNETRNWMEYTDDNLWQGVSGTNNVCPAGFRLPTETELWTEIASWESQNSNGGFASPLKLTMGGYRIWDGRVWGVGQMGLYWTSTVNGDNAQGMQMGDNGDGTYVVPWTSVRGRAFSVRCIMD